MCLCLGLDNTRPLIHEHCKKLLVNMLLLFATHGDHFTVAKLAINSRSVNEPSCLHLVPPTRSQTGIPRLSVCLSVFVRLCVCVCLSVCVCLNWPLKSVYQQAQLFTSSATCTLSDKYSLSVCLSLCLPLRLQSLMNTVA